MVNADNCEKFLQGTALQFARIKAGNDKLPADDASVNKIYTDLKGYVAKSSGPKIKAVVSIKADAYVEGVKCNNLTGIWDPFLMPF